MPERLGELLVQPLRRRLLLEYSLGPANPAELARRLHEPLNLVSYHTGVLVRNGFLVLERIERRRGARTHFYRATVSTVIGDTEWQALPQSLRRALARGALEQSLDEARHGARAGGFDSAHAHLTRSLLYLDDDGRADLSACLADTLEELAAIAARCRKRDTPRRPHHAVLLAFDTAAAPPRDDQRPD